MGKRTHDAERDGQQALYTVASRMEDEIHGLTEEVVRARERIAELEEQAKVRYDVLVDNANRTNEAADRINTEMANLRHEAAVLRADGEQSKTRDFQRIAERDARIAELEAALRMAEDV